MSVVTDRELAELLDLVAAVQVDLAQGRQYRHREHQADLVNCGSLSCVGARERQRQLQAWLERYQPLVELPEGSIVTWTQEEDDRVTWETASRQPVEEGKTARWWVAGEMLTWHQLLQDIRDSAGALDAYAVLRRGRPVSGDEGDGAPVGVLAGAEGPGDSE